MAFTVEDLLSVLHPHCPVKVDALCKNRRRVEHGLTTVGLKIHCLGDNRELLNLIEALGGRSEVIANRLYAHARASVTVILPPWGARARRYCSSSASKSTSDTPSSIIRGTRSRSARPAGSKGRVRQYSLSRSTLDPTSSGATASTT